MNYNFDNYEPGRLPKTKYKLYFGRHMLYSFVTTKLTDEEAIAELKKKVDNRVYAHSATVRIFSERNGEEKLLESFSSNCLYL